ncbi:hypothetical protein A2U01_0076522 [Trifolium medium]|uniref:Uncharacterized protein n=1 Tax=Trifolium medium TaxID=97028 RepID=A0A392T3D1_9FABA|nr:hypothetical protein [Trifolium medium]
MTGSAENGSYDNLKATVEELLKQNEDLRSRMEDLEQGDPEYNETEEEEEEEEEEE